jgi:hypothetical protein
LSPNNVIVNLDRKAGDPTLYLIDFDGFVAPAAGILLEQLTYNEGGTIGTPGYHPPDLAQRVSAGAEDTAPYTDRYGRDMLILELLCFHKELDAEDAPTEWGWQEIERSLEPSLPHLRIPHLQTPDVLTMPEDERPLSYDLANGLGIAIPPRRRIRGRSVSTFATVTRQVKKKGVCKELSLPTEKVLKSACFILWMCCVAHWVIICWWVTARLLPLSEGSRQAELDSWLSGQVAYGLTGFVAFAAGFWALTRVTFTEDKPRFLNVMGMWFQIPARRDCTRSYRSHLVVVIGRLVGILAAMALVVSLLMRYQ